MLLEVKTVKGEKAEIEVDSLDVTVSFRFAPLNKSI